MKKRVIVLSVIALGIACLSISTFVFVQGQKKTFEMPPVISKAPLIQVLDVQMKDQDPKRPDLTAQFRLRKQFGQIHYCL